jgi:hypothetical protein
MDNITQLRITDELKGHLLLNQANFGLMENAIIVASAKGSFKIGVIVDSTRQLFGDRNDIPIESTSFVVNNDLKRFCNYCRKKNHVEKECWKKKTKEKIVGKRKRRKRRRHKTKVALLLQVALQPPRRSQPM